MKRENEESLIFIIFTEKNFLLHYILDLYIYTCSWVPQYSKKIKGKDCIISNNNDAVLDKLQVPNDIVLGLLQKTKIKRSKRRRLGLKTYPKRRRFGLYKSQTTSFWDVHGILKKKTLWHPK